MQNYYHNDISRLIEHASYFLKNRQNTKLLFGTYCVYLKVGMSIVFFYLFARQIQTFYEGQLSSSVATICMLRRRPLHYAIVKYLQFRLTHSLQNSIYSYISCYFEPLCGFFQSQMPSSLVNTIFAHRISCKCFYNGMLTPDNENCIVKETAI